VAQEPIRLLLKEGWVVELQATEDDLQDYTLPTAAVVKINTSDAAEVQASRVPRSGAKTLDSLCLLEKPRVQ
jgi:hypothetical protein